jgi:hypothetical protein
MDGQTDGHGETSIPPYNFVAGGIMTRHMNRAIYNTHKQPDINRAIYNTNK